MLHERRPFHIRNVETPAELGVLLTTETHSTWQGFRCQGLLWLNDSTSMEAIQEYAVVRESTSEQLESITVSWCDADSIAQYHSDCLAPDAEVFYGKVSLTLSDERV